jgi:hypothetical protein
MISAAWLRAIQKTAICGNFRSVRGRCRIGTSTFCGSSRSKRLLVARLSSQGEIMNIAPIPQDDSRKHRLASWFVPPVIVPIMLVALIAASGLYYAHW